MDNRKQDIAYFLSFCIEQYKVKHALSGYDTMQLFARYGVLDYLANHFDILHTQGHHWILEEIEDFINKRKQEL